MNRNEGRGHGRRLHDALVAWLWTQELTRLWLTTGPGTRAARFYEAAGWKLAGTEPNGELLFEKLRPGLGNRTLGPHTFGAA